VGALYNQEEGGEEGAFDPPSHAEWEEEEEEEEVAREVGV